MSAWRYLHSLEILNMPGEAFAYLLIISTLVCKASASGSNIKSTPCLFSSGDRDEYFSLLDRFDGMPFTNIEGQLSKSLEIIHPLPRFRFSKPVGNHVNALDIQLNSSYIALFESGRLGFTNSSSHGDDLITQGDETFMTSVFHISCDGEISINLPDRMQYKILFHSPSRAILSQPAHARHRLGLRDNTSIHRFIRRAESAIEEIEPDYLSPFSFLVGPLKVSDRDQVGFQPRCPLKPFGLESFVKPGARPAGYNGCGADNGMKVPDYRFTDCCNHHDLCYDDCGMTWNMCNDNFRKCMHNTCNDNEPSWSEWGCNNLADVYADAVGTRFGAWAFSNANYDRCACGCPSGTINCTDICMPDCKERCSFIDCSAETTLSVNPKSKTSSKIPTSYTSMSSPTSTSTSAVKTPTSATKKSSGSSATTTLSSTIVTSTLISKFTSTTTISSSTTIAPSGTDVPEECEGDSSWWPFWSTRSCSDKNVTLSRLKTETSKNDFSKASWWSGMSWFTTTNAPTMNVNVASNARNETTIWWWPFF